MNKAPLIDHRTRDMVVKDAMQLALKYTRDWHPQEEDDPGLTMIHLFSRLMEIVISRLNQVPEKNFLSFLDVAGVVPLAPKAAKAPVQFILPEGAKDDSFVPKGTPLATAPEKGEEPVPFETEKGLVLSRSQMKSLFAYDPVADKYKDLTTVLDSNKINESIEFTPFNGDKLIPHKFYVAHDTLLNISQATTVTITFTLVQFTEAYRALFDEALIWRVGVAEGVKEITAKPVTDNGNEITVEFELIDNIIKTKVWGKEHFWLWAETLEPLQEAWSSLNITSIEVSTLTQDILPELAFFNAIALDTTREYYPFGERPKLFDTFFLAIPEALSKEGSKITIEFQGLPGEAQPNIVQEWEFWDGNEWNKLGGTTQNGINTVDFIDTTNAFTDFGVFLEDQSADSLPTLKIVALQAGVKLDVANDINDTFRLIVTDGNQALEPAYIELTFDTVEDEVNGISQFIFVTNLGSPSQFPFNRPKVGSSIDITYPRIEFICPKIEKTKVNNEENYWIRGRITSGNYGEEGKLELTTVGVITPPADRDLTHWKYTETTFRPPVINSIKVSYGYDDPLPITSCLAYRDFSYQTIAVKGPGALEDPWSGTGFIPFVPAEGNSSALYLGFDQAFSNKSISIYISVKEQKLDTQPIVVWEYWNGVAWKNLGVQDGTKNLTESGFIEFIGQKDFSELEMFEKKHCWIRARLEDGDPGIKLLGVYPNTTLAVNATTVTNEILGSSAEKPNAIFQLARFPVLEGQIIQVCEPEKPSEEGQVSHNEMVGEETAEADEQTTQEHWVEWLEVDHFRFSSEKDRHYTINRSLGRVIFGDGVHGMISPAGRDNIKAKTYQAGGGEKGNVARNTITVLKKAIPFVDLVRNVSGSGGGSNDESFDHVKTRGPQAIKHRDRAVTWEDYEWLAKEASFQVARVKCLPAMNASDAGNVTLILVPKSEDKEPYPSEGLIRQVREHMTERIVSTIELNVVGPEYKKVSVRADIKPEKPEEADFVKRLVKKNLEEFFHPLHGGPEGTGWEFGRDVYVSEIYKVIEDTEGVDHVDNALLFDDSQISGYQDGLMQIKLHDDYLVASGNHVVEIAGTEEPVEMVLPIEQYQYLGNTNSKELHDLRTVKGNCHIEMISEKNKRYFSSKHEALDLGYDLCAWCFGREVSKR